MNLYQLLLIPSHKYTLLKEAMQLISKIYIFKMCITKAFYNIYIVCQFKKIYNFTVCIQNEWNIISNFETR